MNLLRSIFSPIYIASSSSPFIHNIHHSNWCIDFAKPVYKLSFFAKSICIPISLRQWYDWHLGKLCDTQLFWPESPASNNDITEWNPGSCQKTTFLQKSSSLLGCFSSSKCFRSNKLETDFATCQLFCPSLQIVLSFVTLFQDRW